jgi:L-lactate dehydrogenase complex protein LldF
MSQKHKDFITASEVRTKDLQHRETVGSSLRKYEQAFAHGQEQYANLPLAKQRAAYIKWKATEELDKYLIEFESNFIRRGGKVIWVQNGAEAAAEILAIARRAEASSVVKMKSMTTEEIELNATLGEHQIRVTETDLGEYIQQLSAEKPYHIVTPAMHKSREQIAQLFHEKFGTAPDAGPEEITEFVRRKLREEYAGAQVAVTGANFIIADTGAVAITENEGNGLLSMAFPPIHIVVAGLEKILPSMTDLDLFWPLLATHATGQNISAYNTLLTGPRQPDETDGPEEMYVILLDNNRSELMEHPEQRSSLSCIRCGACSNVCPVYKNIGGHAYNATYNGPIGSVITPHLEGMREYMHLSQASSICGRCTEVCPVNIDLHKLLLYNRRDAAEKKDLSSKSEKWAFYMWKKVMLKRSTMNQGAKTKNFLLDSFFRKAWGSNREMPRIAPKSFNEIWREEHADIYRPRT